MTTAGQQQTHHHERTVVSAFTGPATEALPANPPARRKAARRRADRLAMASYDQIEAALAYLSMIDPEAFDIALTAAPPQAADESEDDEAIPLCRTCGAPIGIFPELDLSWRHFRGDATASGAHQTFDPGHAPQVGWYLPDEAAEEF